MARTPTSLLSHLPALLLVVTVGFSETSALGCAGFEASDPMDSYAEATLDVDQVLDHPTAQGVLALVNDAAITDLFLDEGLGLDARAATRIIAHRQGPDGYDGTADDNRFDTIIELDEVGYVGEATLRTLGEAAWDLGYVPVIVLEGVPFSADARDATLLLVNSGTMHDLDIGADLDSRAAESIISGRPYAGLMEMAERPYVGPATLEQLLRYADQWVDSAE